MPDSPLGVWGAARLQPLSPKALKSQPQRHNSPPIMHTFARGQAVGYVQTARPINLGKILELLMEVHAHEIFNDGIFNGDPHPGNILLMDDGRLGLIDYGQ
eukprot:6834711-Pyramimonas_sp.AAC.1